MKISRLNKMETVNSGSYIEQGKDNQKFIVEWFKLNALSEEFAEKMSSLSRLGMDSFLSVETHFLSAHPQAMKEDKNLAAFSGLKDCELKSAMNAKLHKIFHAHPSNLSDELRSFMSNAYYYFVTIKNETSEEVQGFITFMSGGPIAKDEHKITILAIDENIRRAGLAGFLITSLKKIGISSNKISVCTRPSNTAAISAYKKWGFIEDLEAQKNASAHFIKGHWIHLTHFE
jgi:ribosomal protein S18 acetylase RimI-like enzyme